MTGRGRRLALLVALGAALAGCGKKGPPQPPVRILPATPGPVAVRQVGGDILLSSTLRATRTDGTPLAAGAEVRVMRMPASQSLRPGLVSERYLVQQFLREAGTIANLDPKAPEGGAGGRLTYRDRGVAAEVPTAAPAQGGTVAFLYALQVVEPGGKSSAMRAPILVEVAAPPSPPGALEGEAAEGQVRLKWQAAPGAVGGYNVYRRELPHGTDPEAPINPTLLKDTEYVDRTFRYDTEYEYFVRAALTAHATPCESPAGPVFDVKPHDHFAPTAPTGIAVAVEGAQIRVYWFPNAEPDLAGYRIYRRAEDESEARMVGEVGATESAFADAGAAAGVRYYYAVSAIDNATPINEGPRSEERSERLPPPGTPAPNGSPGAAGGALR
jgi:hypothetical protein